MSKRKHKQNDDTSVKTENKPETAAVSSPDTPAEVPLPPPKPAKPYFAGIDILKIIAAFFVVGIHTFLYDGFYYTPIQSGDTWFIIPIAMRWLYYCCVPIFMTVTGYLMVNKKLSASYYKGLIRIIVIYAFIGIFCLRVDKEVFGTDLSLWNLAKYFLQFEAADYGWYVRFYVSLFVLIPFLNLAINGLENKKQAVIMVCTIACISVFAKSYFWGFTKDDQIRPFPDYLSDIWPFAYYFFGAYIRKYPPQNKLKAKLMAFGVFAASWAFITLSSYLHTISSTNADNSFHFTSWHFNFYGSYPIYLMTISIFVILYDIKSSNKVVKFILSNISNATYALYLVSYLFDRKSYGDFNAKYPDVNGQWSMDRWHHVYQQHWYVFLNALLWGLVITVGYRLLAWLLSLAVKKLTAPKPAVEIPAETPPPATKE